MAPQPTHLRHSSGRFVKGVSGNPSGRPKGSTGHAAELRRLEEDALKLATNVADTIAETARRALSEIECAELAPLFDAITDVAKAAIKDGGIGPSSVAVLRGWYDDHQEGDPEGNFFLHVGLPEDCSWPVFLGHYRTRGRIDHSRHAADLRTFPPIARRIEELMDQRLMPPVCDAPSNKLKNGFG